jgi:sortase A
VAEGGVTRRIVLGAALVLTMTGGALLADACWMTAKAALAERLIDRAFARHLEDGGDHRPWSWADMHPVARLEVPRLAIRRTVLSGATGSSLAFGPGHVDGTAPPNAPGNSVIAGHRDGWFAFLGGLRVGDELRLHTRDGTRRYEVAALEVTSMWNTEILEPTDDTQLTLVTCHPIEGLTPTEWRYVVRGQVSF